jgi:FtsP/CotA-like multicopper oxidase with cupredoxin domain
MKNKLMQGLLLGSLSALAGSAGAADYYLAAKAYTKTLPDGSAVPMWGYVVEDATDPATTCYNALDEAARQTCIDGLPDPQLSATQLIVDPADTDLNIFLSNGLPEPSSVVIASQENPVSSSGPGPTWDDGSTGPRGPDLAKRVRSFGSEALANGGRESYSWTAAGGNPLRHGSYVLHSGTHPQKQVYMGLNAAVTRDFAVGQAYAGVSYDKEVLLFYSEIDPDLNASIADQSYETSIHYHAKWFLVNGEPYSTDCTDVAPPDGNDDASGYPCARMAQIPDIAAGQPGENILLRFLSVAGETHVPTLQGLHMTLHAEDGQQYNWQNGDTGATTPAPRSQYSVMLPPLKTKDAIINVAADGRFALYDGNGYMTNPTNPENFTVGDPVGGMLRFLSILTDTDSDGVPDVSDNCTLVANGPNTYPAGSQLIQRDTNGDGFGNICDADFNNNGLVDPIDFSTLKSFLGQPGHPDWDMNGNGIVDPIDFSIFKTYLGQPPGPSCATPPPDGPGVCL